MEEVTRAELMTWGGWCMYALANFERLILGCISADFWKEILIFQHLSRSTRFTHFFWFLKKHHSKLKRQRVGQIGWDLVMTCFRIFCDFEVTSCNFVDVGTAVDVNDVAS